jgi:hypothetical protein
MLIYDRNIAQEFAVQYRLTFNLSLDRLKSIFANHGQEINIRGLIKDVLEELRKYITEAVVCTTQHPSGKTLAGWLKETGFSEVKATHDGGGFARKLFESNSHLYNFQSVEDVDRYLKPLVDVVVSLDAPIETDPWITAIK